MKIVLMSLTHNYRYLGAILFIALAFMLTSCELGAPGEAEPICSCSGSFVHRCRTDGRSDAVGALWQNTLAKSAIDD